MSNYNLSAGEFVILQSPSWYLWNEDDEEELEEVVLTNKNLILVNEVSLGLFKRETMLKRCPLDQMLNDLGMPSLVVSKLDNTWWLQASFGVDVIRLRHPSGTRHPVDQWADAMSKAATGDYAGISHNIELPSDLSKLVDGAKGLVGSFAGIGSSIKQSIPGSTPGAAKAPARVNAVCPGCHAPLTGRAGATVTCPYCDTKTTL